MQLAKIEAGKAQEATRRLVEAHEAAEEAKRIAAEEAAKAAAEEEAKRIAAEKAKAAKAAAEVEAAADGCGCFGAST